MITCVEEWKVRKRFSGRKTRDKKGQQVVRGEVQSVRKHQLFAS